MNIIRSFTLILLLGISFNASSQEEDLLSLLEEEETINYVTASFKATRVINLHSLENMSDGELDIRISHRFDPVNGGIYNLFGLDDASIRIGADYGITDCLMIGAGRSSYQKAYDGFVKMKLLRQSTGAKKMPLTMAVFASAVIETDTFIKEEYFSDQVFYSFQMILGRKFSEAFSLQLAPSLVHRNWVSTSAEKNDVFAMGVGGRIKLSKRIALNAEYIYVLPNQIDEKYHNSLSMGLDIETGGHVFQLHFTNSAPMTEKGFITETEGVWSDGGIRFGFNISRVFNLK